LPIQLLASLGALLLLLGCTGKVEPGRTGEEALPTLVPQRVTATVKREAPRLVRLETEHEAFLTTPEHPFATPHSGWVSAGRLAPGDWVVSARFGAVRLLSVRSEPAARPVPVFNLSVDSSHAYFVGTDRVLVHNTKCTGPNDSGDRVPAKGKRGRPRAAPGARDEVIAEAIRARDALDEKIKALKETDPKSPRLAQLKAERDKVRRKINDLNTKRRRSEGVRLPSRDEVLRQNNAADHEAARRARDAAQKELDDLAGRQPNSEAERIERAERIAQLEKEISEQTLTYERTDRIQTWERDLAELEKATPGTDAEREAVEEKKKKLKADLSVERTRHRSVMHARNKRATPGHREAQNKYDRDLRNRLLRLPAYVNDTERARDQFELAEAELADLLQASPSESRDARIHYLTELLEIMNELVELRRERERVKERYSWARGAHGEPGDTAQRDQKLKQEEQRLRAIRISIAQLRLRERLLTRLEGTPWAHGPGSVDEAQLLEFQRLLSNELVTDQQLAEIERTLDSMYPTDADSQQAVLDEAEDVDEVLSDRDELLRQSPSPERAAGLQSSFELLQQELREERRAVEAVVADLANQYAFIQQTQAGSSNGPTWQERLRAIHQEQLDLRAEWRTRLQARLESARERLELRRLVAALRNEAVEAELAREIALLEQELRLAGG
jgi:hypothetical protein